MVRKHGITSLEKGLIADAQDGCAICGCPNPGRKGWGVDHDRKCCTGDQSCPSCRRGILCGWCNSALGYAVDDPVRLRRMADYLELGTRLDVDSAVGSESDSEVGSNEQNERDGQDEADTYDRNSGASTYRGRAYRRSGASR